MRNAYCVELVVPDFPFMQARNLCRVLSKSMCDDKGLFGQSELRLKPDPRKWAVVATRDTRLDACPHCKEENAFKCWCKTAKSGKISTKGPNGKNISVRQPKNGPPAASSRLFTCKRTRISTFFTAEDIRTHVLEYRIPQERCIGGIQRMFHVGGGAAWARPAQSEPTPLP